MENGLTLGLILSDSYVGAATGAAKWFAEPTESEAAKVAVAAF
jgi:hypothetical protein